MEERRRFPRHETPGQLATVPASVNVQVVDISVAGVLLQSSEAIAAGTKGNLRLHLDGSAVRADVEVQRVAAAPAGSAGLSPWRDVCWTQRRTPSIDRTVHGAVKREPGRVNGKFCVSKD
jgi:hypothetical protein